MTESPVRRWLRGRGIGKVRRLAAGVRRRWSSAVGVLLYHRVQDVAADPQLLSVTPAHFSEHLEILRRYYTPISLQQLIRALREHESLPDRSVAVTFDDGYADNCLVAKPLLTKAGVPATVFVTAGSVGARTEFWWDELERIFLEPEQTRTGWNVLCDHDPGPRHEMYRAACQRFKAADAATRDAMMSELRASSGVEAPARDAYRAMTCAETVRLVDDGLIDVGAHTMPHAALAQLDAAAQRAEIFGSKSRLEEILGRPVATFAY